MDRNFPSKFISAIARKVCGKEIRIALRRGKDTHLTESTTTIKRRNMPDIEKLD